MARTQRGRLKSKKIQEISNPFFFFFFILAKSNDSNLRCLTLLNATRFSSLYHEETTERVHPSRDSILATAHVAFCPDLQTAL